MATQVPAKRAAAYTFAVALIGQSDTKKFQVNPTLAVGDVKVSKDFGAFANITTLPTVTPSGGAQVQISLSAAEMAADNVSVQFVDAAGAEWCDAFFNIQTAARQIDDLAYPAVSGRSLNVDATGAIAIITRLKQNQGLANFQFQMTDSTNHNPAAGKVVTVSRVIDNGSFGAGTLGSVAEIGNGTYRLDIPAADLNGTSITLYATATGCDPLSITLLTEPA